uniref:Uncharacterized protein n=1 Tax=Anguilla anguilla TaxID=7936 RepID=A0A0E9XED6_ANGAN
MLFSWLTENHRPYHSCLVKNFGLCSCVKLYLCVPFFVIFQCVFNIVLEDKTFWYLESCFIRKTCSMH